jgi:hypothetical protein
MKSPLLHLAAFLFSFHLPAQSDLQSDPDIQWIGAFTSDYRFDPTMPDPPFEWSWEWNAVTAEKLLMPPLPSGFPTTSDGTELYLKIQFMNALRSRDCKCFDDPQLQTPLEGSEVYGRLSTLDTFFYTDDATKSARFSISTMEVGLENLHGVRLYQQAYLRKSTRMIGYHVVSWAPMLGDGSKGRENVVYKPVCWLPAYRAENPASMAASDKIPYVFVTNTRSNSPALKEFQPLKGEADWKGWLSDFIREPWATAYAHDDSFQELLAEDLLQFSARIDTVIVFDPETFEQAIEVRYKPDAPESLQAARFIVRWFWDDRLRKLYFQPVAWAPVGGVYDENGGLVYLKALFWVKTEE